MIDRDSAKREDSRPKDARRQLPTEPVCCLAEEPPATIQVFASKGAYSESRFHTRTRPICSTSFLRIFADYYFLQSLTVQSGQSNIDILTHKSISET